MPSVNRAGHFSIAFVLAGLTFIASTTAAASPASEAAYAEGQTLLNAKKLPAAADKFEAAVAADPGYASAWYSLAVARRRMNQCAGAIAAYRRYAALEPDKSEPYYGLGLCLRQTGDRPGAIEAPARAASVTRAVSPYSDMFERGDHTIPVALFAISK